MAKVILEFEDKEKDGEISYKCHVDPPFDRATMADENGRLDPTKCTTAQLLANHMLGILCGKDTRVGQN